MSQFFRQLAGIGIVGLFGYAYLANYQEVTDLAEKAGLSAVELPAFRACMKEINSKKISIKDNAGGIEMSKFPSEICV